MRYLIVLLGMIFVRCAYATPPLPTFHALSNETSISGLSSGAFMASQFHVAYSKDLIGVGIVAGGPWNCAGSNPLKLPMLTAATTCMNPCEFGICTPLSYPNVSYLVEQAKLEAKNNHIDDLNYLQDDRIYLFSGNQDKTVITGVVDTTAEFYKNLGVENNNITYNKSIDAGHAFITNNPKDTKCNKTQAPYINDCDIAQAEDLLNVIYQDLNSSAKKKELTGKLIAFDQSEFMNPLETSMDKEAFVYVPKNCNDQQCRIHVVMHGCQQGASKIGTEYITDTGYLEVADTNNIIVLFPQVGSSMINPKGCWDFWGYSTKNLELYYRKAAPQMMAIKSMIDRLIGTSI